MLRGCRTCYGCVVLCAVLALAAGCAARPQVTAIEPQIQFTSVPEARIGGPTAMGAIEGRVIGARPGQRIVLFAKSNVWWIQPFSTAPFTSLDSKFQWKNSTHFGTEYAALLIDANFSPPSQTFDLPRKGGPIAAVARVKGGGFEAVPVSDGPRQLRFSGFDWEVRSEPSDRGGSLSNYDAANAWIDARGRLHLRISKGPQGWHCSEIRLRDSLGYGTYSLTVENSGHLEPAAVLGFYTFDHSAPRLNHREMNIEVSRWGEPLNKSGQFAVQPYYISANVVRFAAPGGRLNHSLRWSPGRADFRTTKVADNGAIADYSFTSGVPAPGEESVFIALYAYGRARSPLTKETEVVVERFEYTP